LKQYTKLYRDILKMRNLSLVIGCGYTSQRNYCKTSQVVALDIDRRKLIHARSQDSKAYFILCDANFLPFKPKSFFDVVCTDILEHVTTYENVVKEIVRLGSSILYLRFPTAEREKLLVKASKVYRKYHWGKIHVRLIDPNKMSAMLKSRYIIHLIPTPAFSTFQRLFLHKMLEIFGFQYAIPDVGLIIIPDQKFIHKFIIYLSFIFGQLFGYPSYCIWKFLRIKTIHDNYIVHAYLRSF